jgi:hypothetical protein
MYANMTQIANNVATCWNSVPVRHAPHAITPSGIVHATKSPIVRLADLMIVTAVVATPSRTAEVYILSQPLTSYFMKNFLPLGLALGLLLVVVFIWDGQYHEPHQTPAIKQDNGRTELKSAIGLPHNLLAHNITSRTSVGSKVTISETAIEQAATGQIDRLEQPLADLFDKWGLSPADLASVLAAIRSKVVAAGGLRNEMAINNSMDSNLKKGDSADRSKSISIQYEAEVLSILGSTQRLYEMTNLIGQVNLKNYRAQQPEMRRQTESVADVNRDVIARMKAQHGDNYLIVMREKFGDVATDSMLALSQGAGD